MNLKKIKDSKRVCNESVRRRTGKRYVSDSKIEDTEAISELISLYNKIQNDETVSKEQAVDTLKELVKKLPGASTDIEVIEEGDEWYIEWGNVILGFGKSTGLRDVLYEVYEKPEIPDDVWSKIDELVEDIDPVEGGKVSITEEDLGVPITETLKNEVFHYLTDKYAPEEGTEEYDAWEWEGTGTNVAVELVDGVLEVDIWFNWD